MLTDQERDDIEIELASEAKPRAAVIEALKTVQARTGWVSDEGIRDVAEALGMSEAEVDSIATFYNTIYRRPVGEHVILVCDSVSCWLTGYEDVYTFLRTHLGVVYGETTQDRLFTLLPVACLGACDKAPVMMVDEELHVHLDNPGDIEAALIEHGWQPNEAPAPAEVVAVLEGEPVAATPTEGLAGAMEAVLTRNMRSDCRPCDIKAYERSGGYEGYRRALRSTPEEVRAVVKEAGLRGRGGAGFPTADKWSFVPMGEDAQRPKYYVVNGDEMEPGTFKDRLLLEGDPHEVIEGAMIGAFAVQADIAYIFIRREYHEAARRVRHAIVEAEQAGYLGTNIRGSGWSLKMHVHVSGGRYMCGEETALLNALEGKRANPRNKPPFPQVSGLWGKPTVLNNVETAANIPQILARGAEWYQGLGLGDNAGTKMYGASGNVANPGLWELPFGTSLREILYEHAGGMRDGAQLRGVLPGGGSTPFLTADRINTALDYQSCEIAGSRLGTGTMIVLDDAHCPVGMLVSLERFYARESCGWCTPCREGLPWVRQILEAIEEGRGQPGDLEQLDKMSELIGPMGRTFCPLAPGAMAPLGSALKSFRDDFERHITEGRCHWRQE